MEEQVPHRHEEHEPTMLPIGDDPVQWARRFDLLSDPSRLKLLLSMHLVPGSSVGELAESAEMSPTATSQALRVLREQGWVQAERDGRIMRYRLVDDTAHRLLHFMGQRH
ncbi:MAG: metalloregulator ArsR/SmtB family transcription factor [Dermatophilus congolensis]|nr:metalloregulator ArsR/SmtB family transcription factor [Dermatophilus congolensis]